MRKIKNKEKCRKLRIRINPERSPLKLIIKNQEKNEKSMKKAVYKKNLEEAPIGFVDRIDKLSRQVQMLVDEEEYNDKQYQLLKMVYKADVNAEYAENTLGISENELRYLVDELVELGYLKYSSDDEAVITEEGISYLNWLEINSGQ